MVRLVLLLAAVLLLASPLDTRAETKKAQAERVAKKEQVKKKIEQRKAAAASPKTLDLKLEDSLMIKTTPEQIRQNLDMDSQYAPAEVKNRGDVSLKPEFRMPEDPDVTKNGDYKREKEFKLKFGVGL